MVMKPELVKGSFSTTDGFWTVQKVDTSSADRDTNSELMMILVLVVM